MPAQAIVVTRLSLILPRSLPTAAVTQAKQVSFSCGFVLFFSVPGLFVCKVFSPFDIMSTSIFGAHAFLMFYIPFLL